MMKKICVICEICVTKKRPKKNLCISVKSVGQNFHRISRMNRRAFLLIGLLTDFRGIWPLANGWRTKCSPVVFCHADFADDADFSSWDYFCPTDFTDFHRFFMESLVNRFVQSQGVSATTGQVASAKIRE